MELQDIINPSDIEGTIEALKNKSVSVPSWSDLAKKYDQKEHEIIADKALRPDDKIGSDGKKEEMAKITYPAEKIAVRRMVQMAFTIPVKRIYNTVGDNGKDNKLLKDQSKAIESAYESVRIDGENMNRMRAYFAACEILTVWYAVEGEKEHTLYGFPTKFKLRCRSYSPMPEEMSKITQASLYPLFDEYDDMIAMSFEYIRSENDADVTYFETYTADTHYRWKNDGGWIEDIAPEKIVIGKIPAVYLRRPQPIWEGISNNRKEIEFTLSRQSDVIRKNSAPIIVVEGELIGEKPVGDKAREVYNVKQGGGLDVVSPTISKDVTEYHISQLKQNIEEDLQLPNLSLENIKGLGAMSGEARKTLLTDGHLKVGEEKHDIIRFFDRESNVIKALFGKINTKWEHTISDLPIEHIVTAFVQNDELSEIEKMEKGTGGKQLVSRRTAISRLNLVDDVDAEIALIQDEEQAEIDARRMSDVFEGGM